MRKKTFSRILSVILCGLSISTTIEAADVVTSTIARYAGGNDQTGITIIEFDGTRRVSFDHPAALAAVTVLNGAGADGSAPGPRITPTITPISAGPDRLEFLTISNEVTNTLPNQVKELNFRPNNPGNVAQGMFTFATINGDTTNGGTILSTVEQVSVAAAALVTGKTVTLTEGPVLIFNSSINTLETIPSVAIKIVIN